MNSSENINELASALARFQAEVKPAIKGSTNPYFKSKYADLQACWDAAREPLTKNGLSLVQGCRFSEGGDVVTIETRLMHSSGQWIENSLTMKPAKADPQGIGSCITYGRRYSMGSTLGLVTEEDDDGNAATHEPAAKKPVELPAGATRVPALISDESIAFFKLSAPSLVKRVIDGYKKTAFTELTEAQAQKGITFIKAEMSKAEATKKKEEKEPF